MAKKFCRADIRKAIINTAYSELIKDRKSYSPVENTDDMFYITNSERVINNRSNDKRSVALAIAKSKITQINKKFKNRLKAVIMDTDTQSPVQFRILVDPDYIEHEFAKLPEEKQNDIFVNDIYKDADFFNPDYALSEQALFEQDLAEDKDRFLAKPEEDIFAYTKEEGEKESVKPGVQELFDSTPELANAVYQAAGFTNTSEIQLDKPRFNPDNAEATSYPIKINGKYAGVISINENGYISSSIGMAGVELEKEFQGKGYGTKIYIALAEQLAKEGKTLKSEAFGKKNINEAANRVWKSLLDKGYAINKGDYYEVINIITPQQKQQAQQLYSQYLDSIFPDSKVKDIVYRGGEGGISNEQYYTLQKEYAERYGKVIPVILNLSNPVISDKGIHRSWVKDELTNRGLVGKDYPGSTSDAVIEQMNGDIPFSAKGKFDVYVIKNSSQKLELGSKQDIEGFKKFLGKENTYFQTEEKGETKVPVSENLNIKIVKFLSKIGVAVQSVDRITDALGNKLDAVAKANMLDKIIQVVEGRAGVDTLPEEAAHFFVEMLGEGHPLFKDMMSKIEGYDVYQYVVDKYGKLSEYKNPDGTVNYDKLRKEAIGKMIAKHIIQGDPGAETENKLIGAISFWQKLWEFVKSIFSKATYNPFEQAAAQILEGSTEGLSEDNLKRSDEYYQLADPVQGLLNDQSRITLDNSIDALTSQKRHIYAYDGVQGKGSVTSVYVDKWLKKIFRSDTRSDIKKMVDLAKAELGDVVHEQIQDLVKSMTNPDGTIKRTPSPIAPKVDPVTFKILKDYIANTLAQYEEGTRFFAELKVYDKRTNIAGSIDLLVVKPDGYVDIYDWKTQEIFKDQTDIKTYKEPMYRIQLDNYRKILEAQYGFSKFGKIRAIPIATQYNFADRQPTSIKSIEIGDIDVSNIPESKNYLLPVTLKTELTGNQQLDELIQKLHGIYDKIELNKKGYSAEEVYKKREELAQFRSAIRDLQLRSRIEKLIELGLVEFKKYSDKLYSKTLKGKEISEALSILNVFSKSGLTLNTLRQDILKEIDPENKKALEEFKATEEKLLSMNAQVDKLVSDITEYQKQEASALAERNGIMNLLKAEKAIGSIKGLFSSLSNLTQSAFRVFSKLLRRAQNIRDAKFDEKAEKLSGLKKDFITWTRAKGISVEKGMEMLLNIDSKGNWNGNFLSIYRPEFYKAKEKAIEDSDLKWLTENLIFDEEKYAEAEKKQIEFFNTIVYSSEELENKKIIASKIKEWIDEHNAYNEKGKINIKAYLNSSNRFLKADDTWFSDKWITLNRAENKPLLNVYNEFQSLLRESEKLGMLDKFSPHFIPSILADKMDQIVFGDIKGFFSKNGLFENLQVDSGTKFTPETDPTTGQIINRVPVYFTKDMGVRNEKDGTVDYSKKSRDLFKVFGTWAAHMYNYEAMQTLEDDAIMLLEVERNKKSLVTDNFGNVVIENGQVKAENQNDRNAKLLEDFVNYYLYDRVNGRFKDKKITIRGKEYSLLKTVNSAMRWMSLKTLGFNFISGTANFVGGTGNALFMAQKGIFFTKKSWAHAVALSTGDKKAWAALEYMNVLQEGRTHQLINDLSLSSTNQILNTDNAFIVQRATDKMVQYPIAMALMLNHMVEDGRIVDIQKFVKDKYDYNNTFYNLSTEAQKSLRDKIDAEVAQLQKDRSLYAVGKIDDKGKFSLPGIEKTSDTMEEFRSKIKGVSKKILGNNSREDINGIRTTMLGSALMQFRNWMPEMIEERFDGLRYDDELQTWTYGKFRTFFSELASKRVGKLAKAIATGMGHNAVEMAKESYERLKRDAYERGEDFTITEGEYIDLYIGNMKSMLAELTVILGFTALVFSIAAAGDDDDDKENKGMKRYLARAYKKYYSEFLFYYNPRELTKLIKSPVPMVGLAEDLQNFGGALLKETTGQLTGNEKMQKSAQPAKYFFRMVPIAKELLLIFATFSDDFRKDWDIRIN